LEIVLSRDYGDRQTTACAGVPFHQKPPLYLIARRECTSHPATGEDYGAYPEIMEDGKTFPLDFNEWEKNAESERAAAKRGSEHFTSLPRRWRILHVLQREEISPNRTTAAEFTNSRGAASYSLGP
jgi:hypothetical protein